MPINWKVYTLLHLKVCISLVAFFSQSIQKNLFIFCKIPLLYTCLFHIRISQSDQWALWQMLQLPVKHRVICSLLMYSRNWSWLSKHELMYLLNCCFLYIVSVCTGCLKKVAPLKLFGIFSLRLSLFAWNFANLLAIHFISTYIYQFFVDLS